MKIATSLPTATPSLHQELQPQAPERPENHAAQADQTNSLALLVQPRTRGIHPFLAATLGDKGCAASSSVSLQSDLDTAVQLDDFVVASRDVNRHNLCAGLATEWLLMSDRGDAQSRMDQLDYGSPGQERGAQRHRFYKEALAGALAGNDQVPFLTASRAMLRNAGLRSHGRPTSVLAPGDSSQLARSVAKDVAQAGRKHLLSLRFTSAKGHAVACTCAGSQFKLFDPNLGEFQCPRSVAGQLIELLLNHYGNVAGVNEFRVA